MALAQDFPSFIIAGLAPADYLCQRSKTAHTNIVFIKAAITNARSLYLVGWFVTIFSHYMNLS